jgi:hypothetical protein
MVREEGLFTISEDEVLEEEIINVAEQEEAPKFRLEVGDSSPPRGEDQVNKDNGGWLKTKDISQFVQFLDDQMSRIPTVQLANSNLSMMERSLGQWKRLNNYCSEAMRGDFNSSLDVDNIDTKRYKIEQNIQALEDALYNLDRMKRNRKKMRRHSDEDTSSELTKEATVPHFSGFQMVLTPFQRAIAGALINGKVSGGRNMEELWSEARKKYNMDAREELEILQIISDMGYPEFKDRLQMGGNEDPTRESDFGEWQSQYYA